MNPEDIKKHYKTGYTFHKLTGMSAMSYWNWLKWGYVPFESQMKLQKLTQGQLKAEWEERGEAAC
jgi:hypothetical protein